MNSREKCLLINENKYILEKKNNKICNFIFFILCIINLVLNSFIIYTVINLTNNAEILFNSSLVTDIDKINTIINYVCKNIMPSQC
jgi:hypothetical protein